MKKLIVFTDLDGTLLDHETYDWKPAQTAIQTLKENGFPVIINSSKTSREIQILRQDMEIDAPYICENGSVVHLNDQIQQFDGSQSKALYFSMPYAEIIEILKEIKSTRRFNMTGFSELNIDTLMELTGLSESEAIAAKDREATEPLLWNDSEESLFEFEKILKLYELTITRGGRFYHVMSPVNKGDSINWVINKYQQLEPDTQWKSIGLGDSYNDIPMLEQVDYPVLIRNPQSTQPNVRHIYSLRQSKEAGPAGWNTEVLNIIKTM